MLERQIYPDLRYRPGGSPIPPYDVTAQTLGLLMGVDVRQVEEPIVAALELLDEIVSTYTPLPSRPDWGYVISSSSNAGFMAANKLQASGIPVFRAAREFDLSNGERLEPGAWIVPPRRDAERVLENVAQKTGLVVSATNQPPAVEGYRLKLPTRVGLWRVANNMPGGWMMWLFEQYGIDKGAIFSEFNLQYRRLG